VSAAHVKISAEVLRTHMNAVMNRPLKMVAKIELPTSVLNTPRRPQNVAEVVNETGLVAVTVVRIYTRTV
jgi:hypothetical protein